MDTDSLQPVVAGIFDMSSGRLAAIVAYVAGLAGVVLAGLALRAISGVHSDGEITVRHGRGRPTIAIVLGLVSLVIGGVVVATADGGVGSGNGLGGGIVAIALGLVSLVLGGLAHARARARGLA